MQWEGEGGGFQTPPPLDPQSRVIFQNMDHKSGYVLFDIYTVFALQTNVYVYKYMTEIQVLIKT